MSYLCPSQAELYTSIRQRENMCYGWELEELHISQHSSSRNSYEYYGLSQILGSYLPNTMVVVHSQVALDWYHLDRTQDRILDLVN